MKLTLSKLDYCIFLYHDISCSLTKNCNLRKITILIYNKRKYDLVTELLLELDWLTIKYRILYKIYLLTYKCINPTLFAHPEELKSLVSIDSKSTCFIRLKMHATSLKLVIVHFDYFCMLQNFRINHQLL